MNILDLFSGIGGFSLGLERAGMKTVTFCEIDLFCQKVLKKHWPNIPIINDIHRVTKNRLIEMGVINSEASNRTIDLVCGGFP
jgi:DNA (cytosine-5)-methyltransferase 1